MTRLGWDPRAHLDSCVRDVLTAPDSQVDTVVGNAALLIMSMGGAAEADRLCERWLAMTERPAASLVADALAERAFARLFAARGAVPAWARGLTPLDPASIRRAHRDYLERAEQPVLPAALGDSTLGRVVAGVAGTMSGGGSPHPLRQLAARAEAAAAEADSVAELLAEWVGKAGPRPNVAMLAGGEHLAPLLLRGALAVPLGVDTRWPATCAGDLIAALTVRYLTGESELSWAELIARVLTARSTADLPRQAPPPPASAKAIGEAEWRLDLSLPADLRAFFSTSDGLPADVVFPRLLSVSELRREPEGIVVLSERTPAGFVALTPAEDTWRVVEWDDTLGPTVHLGMRQLLETHLRLLES